MKINEKREVNYGEGISGTGVETCLSKNGKVEVHSYEGPDWGMSDGIGISNTKYYHVIVDGREINARYSDRQSAEELAEQIKNGNYKV